MATAVDTAHWHAFSYTGYERPADQERIRPENPTPPLEIAHWLRKPARLVEATFLLGDETTKAREWLEQQLAEYPRGDWDLPAEAQMRYAQDCLERGDDVVWGYYSAKGRYVSRALVCCPRAGEACPAPPRG